MDAYDGVLAWGLTMQGQVEWIVKVSNTQARKVDPKKGAAFSQLVAPEDLEDGSLEPREVEDLMDVDKPPTPPPPRTSAKKPAKKRAAAPSASTTASKASKKAKGSQAAGKPKRNKPPKSVTPTLPEPEKQADTFPSQQQNESTSFSGRRSRGKRKNYADMYGDLEFSDEEEVRVCEERKTRVGARNERRGIKACRCRFLVANTAQTPFSLVAG